MQQSDRYNKDFLENGNECKLEEFMVGRVLPTEASSISSYACFIYTAEEKRITESFVFFYM